MFKRFIGFYFLGIGIMLVGCSKVSSEDIAVKAMYFTMALQKDNGQTVECYTRVSVTDELGSSVELSRNDSLTCNGTEMRSEKSLIGDYLFYKAQVPSVVGGSYVITYVRDGKVVGSGHHMLPERLNLLNPGPGFLVGLAQPLQVQWTSYRGQTITASLTAEAPKPGSENGQSFYSTSQTSASETGLVVLPSMNQQIGFVPNQNLGATLTITGINRGTMDSGLRGHFDAVQTRSISGTLVP